MEKRNEILIGKNVLNTKGVIIGNIQESIKDGDSGEIVSVLIKPSEDLKLQNYALTQKGKIVIPYSSLSFVKDIIIIEDAVN